VCPVVAIKNTASTAAETASGLRVRKPLLT
jgi:hypothetical protein